MRRLLFVIAVVSICASIFNSVANASPEGRRNTALALTAATALLLSQDKDTPALFTGLGALYAWNQERNSVKADRENRDSRYDPYSYRDGRYYSGAGYRYDNDYYRATHADYNGGEWRYADYRRDNWRDDDCYRYRCDSRWYKWSNDKDDKHYRSSRGLTKAEQRELRQWRKEKKGEEQYREDKQNRRLERIYRGIYR